MIIKNKKLAYFYVKFSHIRFKLNVKIQLSGKLQLMTKIFNKRNLVIHIFFFLLFRTFLSVIERIFPRKLNLIKQEGDMT